MLGVSTLLIPNVSASYPFDPENTNMTAAIFAKKFDETVINTPLSDVIKVWKEGWLIKKVCIRVKEENEQKDYKFGVLGTGSWLETLQDAIEDFKNQ